MFALKSFNYDILQSELKVFEIHCNTVYFQLTVYNYKGSPCYRCLHPLPPNPQFVTNCSDGGVLGVGESNYCSFQK